MKTYNNENAGYSYSQGYETYNQMQANQLTGFADNGVYRPAGAGIQSTNNQIPMIRRQPLVAMRMNSMRPIQMPINGMQTQHFLSHVDRSQMSYADQQQCWMQQQNNLQNQMMSCSLNQRNSQQVQQNYDQNENQQPLLNRRPNPAMQSASSSTVSRNPQDMPYIEIVEQPASRSMRFRYQCEGRSAGNIPGAHSTPEKKTFPSIKVHNYTGKVKIVVSCVTDKEPYKVHPHKITSKDHSKDGVICLTVNGGEVVHFTSLGIQCAKKKDVEKCINEREKIKIDPFKSGYDHKTQSIDLNAVRLAFQGFIKIGSKWVELIKAVASEPIYDKKSVNDLVIVNLSHYSASVLGGTKMILLCEKVTKEDIQIRFFEEDNEEVVWEGMGSFSTTDVHRQTAISFRTPSYKDQEIENPVKVFIELRRPSDGATSRPIEFEMLPIEPERDLRRKRFRPNEMENEHSGLQFSAMLQKELGRLLDNANTIQTNGNFNFPNQTMLQAQKSQTVTTTPQSIQSSNQLGLQVNNQRGMKRELMQNPQTDLQYGQSSQSNYEIPQQNLYEMTEIVDNNYYDEQQFANAQNCYQAVQQQNQMSYTQTEPEIDTPFYEEMLERSAMDDRVSMY